MKVLPTKLTILFLVKSVVNFIAPSSLICSIPSFFIISSGSSSLSRKVDAIDYKYFVDPNIPKFKITKEWLEEIRNSIPELPYERKEKYISSYGFYFIRFFFSFKSHKK